MRRRAIILHPLKGPVLESYEDRGDDTYQEFSRMVGGGFVECVRFYPAEHDIQDWHLACYVDDNGIAAGMPLNRRIGGHDLYGPVVVVKERIELSTGTSYYESVRVRDLDYLRIIDGMWLNGELIRPWNEYEV